MPPGEIARRLDDRFRLLRAGPRTVEPRQQTLQAMVDWSYALLSTSERQVFTRLGVCAGGISLDGAEIICSGGDVDPLDVLDLVGRLVDKSLVLADHDEGGTPRFRLLETLRAYALDRLGHGEEWEDAHRRHAEYMADLAEAAWIGLRGPDQSEWFARLDSEHDNVRVALGWAVGRDATLAHGSPGTWGGSGGCAATPRKARTGCALPSTPPARHRPCRAHPGHARPAPRRARPTGGRREDSA